MGDHEDECCGLTRGISLDGTGEIAYVYLKPCVEDVEKMLCGRGKDGYARDSTLLGVI